MKPIFNSSHLTLKQVLFSMFEKKEGHTEEFKAMVMLYGMEKVKAYYDEWKIMKGKTVDYKMKAGGE